MDLGALIAVIVFASVLLAIFEILYLGALRPYRHIRPSGDNSVPDLDDVAAWLSFSAHLSGGLDHRQIVAG